MCGGNLKRFLTISVVTLALPTLCAAVYVIRRFRPGAVPPGMTTRRRREHRLGTRGRRRDGRRRRRSAGGRDGGGSDLDGDGAASDYYGDANSGTEGWSDTGELVQNLSASSPAERLQLYAWLVIVMSALPLQALWLADWGKGSGGGHDLDVGVGTGTSTRQMSLSRAGGGGGGASLLLGIVMMGQLIYRGREMNVQVRAQSRSIWKRGGEDWTGSSPSHTLSRYTHAPDSPAQPLYTHPSLAHPH
jgi:hypothetical protein